MKYNDNSGRGGVDVEKLREERREKRVERVLHVSSVSHVFFNLTQKARNSQKGT